MTIPMIFSSFILLITSYEDIKNRKVKNQTILGLASLCILYSIFNFNFELLQQSLLGVAAAFLFLTPLYIAKSMGAGDLKVSMLLGYCIGPVEVINTLIFSFIFALFLGIIQIALQKKFHLFYINILNILTFKKTDHTSLNQIPFTVALFLGWVVQIFFQKKGGLFL